jgi:hypothetical protein
MNNIHAFNANNSFEHGKMGSVSGGSMVKSAEHLLVTATVGAVAMVGNMSWTGVAKLIATFTYIAEVLQARL